MKRLSTEKEGLTQRRKAGRSAEQTSKFVIKSLCLGVWVILSALFSPSCGTLNRGPVRPHLEEPFPLRLSEWRLFVGKPSHLQPNEGVVPYEVNTALFKDYAGKHRFVWMLPGTSAVYSPAEVFQFPIGTILSKTFTYPGPGRAGEERLIETRLLVHSRSGWVGLPYVWNDSQTDATLQVAPDRAPVQWTDWTGRVHNVDYEIPNTNQCKNCHVNSKVMGPLGPSARNLNRERVYADGRYNQLAYWTKVGYLTGAPLPENAPRLAVWDDPATGTLGERARSYLDVNCGNCHNPRGSANTSGVYLTIEVNDPLRLGVCKVPVSAGLGSADLRFDVVPGKPEESILVRRMASTTPKVMMPELGRSVEHEEGVALITEWVAQMQGKCGARTRL